MRTSVAIMGSDSSEKYAKKKRKLEEYLTSGEVSIGGRVRSVMRLIPSDPRCKFCNTPFAGVGGHFSRLVLNRRPSSYTPRLCSACFDFVKRTNFEMDLQMSMLFADVRGSTTLAERMSDAEFSHLLNRFYKAATAVLVKRDALIDNLIGDEVVAMFIPGLVGADHARRSIETAREILRATGHGDPSGPWIPVGVGVHTGQAHLGAVGSPEGITDIAVLGDNVNIAARLASVAGAGQIIVSEETSTLANLDVEGLENRKLELKGKSEPTNVRVITQVRSVEGPTAPSLVRLVEMGL